MSHISFKSLHSKPPAFGTKFNDSSHGGAREPIEKNLKNRSVAPPRGRIWIIFWQYINDVISLPTMTSFFDES